MKVVISIAIYVAAIWAGSMDKRAYRTRIEAAYRRSAIRVISAFRKVPTKAAGTVPLRLVVGMERRKRETRRGIDLSNPIQLMEDAVDKWQQDWTNSYKGRLTYRLIPSVGEWTKSKYVRNWS